MGIKLVILSTLVAAVVTTSNGKSNSSGILPGDNCDERVTRWCDMDSGLWCRAGSCKCFKNYMTFDVQRNACVSKVWFPCGELSTGDIKLPNVHCVENAVCMQERVALAKPQNECRCKQGYQENDDGFCVNK
jgi:hypothetical protein